MVGSDRRSTVSLAADAAVSCCVCRSWVLLSVGSVAAGGRGGALPQHTLLMVKCPGAAILGQNSEKWASAGPGAQSLVAPESTSERSTGGIRPTGSETASCFVRSSLLLLLKQLAVSFVKASCYARNSLLFLARYCATSWIPRRRLKPMPRADTAICP